LLLNTIEPHFHFGVVLKLNEAVCAVNSGQHTPIYQVGGSLNYIRSADAAKQVQLIHAVGGDAAVEISDDVHYHDKSEQRAYRFHQA
jgi:hypothetical protein